MTAPLKNIKVRQLSSSHLAATVISQGAALQSLILKRPGKPDLDIIRGLGAFSSYKNNPEQVGAVVGRVAGRIRKGQFQLGAKHVQLLVNDGENTLHGGPKGFAQCNWCWEGGDNFSLSSLDGDQGFPGNLEVKARYSLPQEHTLRLELSAACSAPTPINLTHHPYWKLLDGDLKVHGQQSQALDKELLPVGGYVPFVAKLDETLDNCVRVEGGGFREMARITYFNEKFSMSVWSDSSHLQVYNGKCGYICLEPQGPVDAMNIPDEQSLVLTPGDRWKRKIEYRFEF